MIKTYIKIVFIVLPIITGLVVFSLFRNKPFITASFSDDINAFTSGNFNLTFNYPKSIGVPKVEYPSTFSNESINFNNGLVISYWVFEGFFGPYESSEELKTRDGKSCNLNTFKQGLFNESNGIFAQCKENVNDFHTVTFILQELNDQQLNESLPVVRSIINSLEYNYNWKIVNLF